MNRQILIVLDRDGTINLDPPPGYFGQSPTWKQELKIYPGVIEGLKILQTIPNSILIVATNQAGIARGFLTPKRTEEVNAEIDNILKKSDIHIARWYYCPYASEKYAKEKRIKDKTWIRETDLRKPKIGMIKNAIKELELNPKNLSIFVLGDKISDVQTALNSNGIGILIKNGLNEEEIIKTKSIKNERVFIVDNFLDSVKLIKQITQI
jgi:histidinol-phosphate phosphatase family protein